MHGRQTECEGVVRQRTDVILAGSLLYLLAMIIAAAVDDDTVPVNAVGDP